MHRDDFFDGGLVLAMQGLLYHSIACLFFNLTSEKEMQMNCYLLILYVPLVLFSVVRSKCNSFIIFMTCHAAILYTFLCFMPVREMQAVIGGCVAVMIFSSVHLRINSTDVIGKCPSAASVGLFVAVYVTAQLMKRPLVMQTSYYEAFLFLIFYAIHKSFENTAGFIKSSEDIANLPAGQIRGMNKLLLSLFILCLAGVMFIMQNLPADNLFFAAGKLLVLIIRGIVWILSWLFSRESAEPERSSQAAEESVLALEAGKTSVLLQILEEFITAVFCLAIIAGAAYFTVRIVYDLYKRFYEQQKKPVDESEFLWKQPWDQQRVRGKVRKQENLKGTTANRKIRRLYKRKIRQTYGKKIPVPSAMTPEELEEQMTRDKESGRDLEDIKKQRIALYEKARYSQHKCDQQEVEVMKQYIRK